MSIVSENRVAGPYAANGALTNFAFSFKVFAESDLQVTYLNAVNVETILTLTTDYTVTLNPDQDVTPGGSITTVATYLTGTFITLTTAIPYTQTLELVNAGGFYPSAIETALDRSVALMQQLNSIVSRAAVAPISAASLTNLSSLVFGLDALGKPVTKVLSDINPAVTAISAFILTLLDDTTDITARATLGIPGILALQSNIAVTTAGTAPVYTCSTPVTGYGTALANNQILRVKFHADGTTGSNTLNRASLGAKNLKQLDATGVKIPAIVKANQLAYVEYDGTDYVILNPLPPTVPTNIISVPKRQTALAGPIDSNGFPSFLPATSVNLNLTSQNITGSAPLTVTSSNGFGALGQVDSVGQSTTNLTWTGLTASATNYLYVDISGGILTPGFTTLAPVYQFGGTYSITNLQNTFNIQEMVMKVGNGATASQVNRVFIGEAVTNATTVTSTVAYAYQGRYDSGYTATLPGISTLITKNHNLGLVALVSSKEIIECTTTDAGYAVGDTITDPFATAKVLTRNTVQTTTGNGIATILANKTTGVNVAATAASWKYKFVTVRDW